MLRPPNRHRGARRPSLTVAANGIVAGVAVHLLAACGEPREAVGETPPPLIVAEHPVTSEAARRAGVAGDGASSPRARPGAVLVPHLGTADVAAGVVFYRDLLAFEVAYAVPSQPPYLRVELERGDARLVLEETAQPDVAASAPALALRLPGDELAAALRRLSEAGVEVGDGGAEGGVTVVDPAGHLLRLVAADGRATKEVAGGAAEAADADPGTAPPPAP